MVWPSSLPTRFDTQASRDFQERTADPPTSRGNHPGALDIDSAFEREELVAATLRLKQAVVSGLAIWFAFGALDIVVNIVFDLHQMPAFAGLRLGGGLLVLAVWKMVVRYPPESLTGLRVADSVIYTMGAVLITVMCTLFWGLKSPYGPGICLILAGRTIVANEPWKKALVASGVPALAFPVTMLLSALVSPTLAAQFHDRRAVAIFTVTCSFVLGTVLIMVVSSHVVWSLRRQLFEARNIGRYKLTRRVGSGGMGEVWLADDRVLMRAVALKFLRTDIRDAGVAVARFKREVRATARLTHAHTIRVFDYGTTHDGLCYYAMEYLEGETLAAFVRREGPLAAERAISIGLQVAGALGEAHACGIIHRDVKPENLFLTSPADRDFVKVLDFGIAKVIGTGADASATIADTFVGTPAYVSPEVAAGKAAGPRSDVYSLGAVIYFLLCGHPPFEAENARLILSAHVQQSPVPPSSKLGRPLPAALEAVVLRCLEKDPDARFASATLLAAALAECRVPEPRRMDSAPLRP